jgi:16S rRNA (uracil1498-N3)-methyltransferase
MSPRAAGSVTRLIVRGEPLRPGRLLISRDAARHAWVARVRPGERLEVLDLQGAVAAAVVVRWERGECLIEIDEVQWERGEPPGPLVLALGVLDSEAFSWAVEKATELGVTAVQPVLCARVQRRDHRARGERWRRVAAAAVAQCGRTRPPQVLEPRPLAEVCATAVGVRWLADVAPADGGTVPEEAGVGATVLVGPEGGFTAEEVQLVRTAGFSGLWLGPRILRAETAALAALVLAQQRLGWLEGKSSVGGSHHAGEGT